MTTSNGRARGELHEVALLHSLCDGQGRLL